MTARRPPWRGRRGGRAARRSAAGGMSADALVVFTPSGRRGRVARGTSVLDAARTLGVDLDSVCGGRGICGRCQVTVAEGEHAKHGITCTSAALDAGDGDGAGVRRRPRPRRRPASRLHGARRGGRRDRRPAGEPGVPAGRAQGGRRALDRRRSRRPPVLRRGRGAASSPRRASDLGRLLEALEREWELARSLRRSSRIAIYSTCSTRRPGLARHGRGPRRVGRHGDLAGLPRRGVRDRVRRRLDDRRRPPLRPAHRRRARVGGRDEPADPLRRGPDEPRLVRHAQRRLGEGAHAGGPRLPREADRRAVPRRRASSGRTSSRSRSSGIPSCITSCSESTRPSSAARRSRSPSTQALRLHAGELGLPVNPGARAYVLPCIAGHVGADTAGVILAEAPHLADEVQPRSSTSARTPRSCSATASGCSPRRARRGPAFEGAQISCGQRAAPGAIERVRIDRRRSSRASRDRLRRLVGRARVSRRARHGRLRLGDRRGGRRAPPRGRADARTGRSTAPLAARTPRIVPDGRTFSYVLWDEPELRDHPERHPADPARQGARSMQAAAPDGALRRRPRRRVRLAGAFGAHIDPVHALVLGLVPDCEPDAVTSAGNAAGTGARIALARPAARARDRGRRPAGREGRDGGRAALSGALRPRDGDSRTTPTRTRAWRRASRSPPRRTPVRPAGRRRRTRAAERRGVMTETRGRRSGGRAGTPGGAAARARRARPVPDPDARPRSRCSRTRGSRSSRRTPTGSSRRWGSSSTTRPTRSSCFAGAGAAVDGERVRFPRGLCRSLVQATAPTQFTQVARNRANDVVFGGERDDLRAGLRLAVRP